MKPSMKQIKDNYFKYRGKPRNAPVPAVHATLMQIAYFDPLCINLELYAEVFKSTHTGFNPTCLKEAKDESN